MSYTEDDIGKQIKLTYPQGTAFITTIVENTCVICGDTYIGPKEEVAHLLAQHSIIHSNEHEQLVLGIGPLEEDELRGEFEAHAFFLTQFYEEMPDLRRKILASIKLCLARYSGIRLTSTDGDEQ